MCLCSDHDCTAGAWTPAALGLRLSWYWPGAAAVECAGLEAGLAFVWGLQRFAESSVGTVRSSLCSLAVSVHIWLQVPASKRGGLQGEENGDYSQKHRLCCFFSRRISFPFVSVPCTSLTEPYFCKVGGRIWSFHGSGKSVHGLGEYKCCLSSSSDI